MSSSPHIVQSVHSGSNASRQSGFQRLPSAVQRRVEGTAAKSLGRRLLDALDCRKLITQVKPLLGQKRTFCGGLVGGPEAQELTQSELARRTATFGSSQHSHSERQVNQFSFGRQSQPPSERASLLTNRDRGFTSIDPAAVPLGIFGQGYKRFKTGLFGAPDDRSSNF